MSATIDSTYQGLVAQLPLELRDSARGLLFELGLAHTPGMGWADVFQLPPSRELPLFALSSEHAPSEPRLEAFRRAHHGACFYNVLVDRLADRQAAATPERERLAAHFLAYWRRSLAEAEGGTGSRVESIERSIRAWRLGVGLEQAALARRTFRLARYGRSILLKLGWAGLASECLLRQRGESHRSPSFRRAFFLLAVGMQCVDDAEDSAEDEAVHGVSLPTALGFPPPALFSAGALLTRAAGAAAARGASDTSRTGCPTAQMSWKGSARGGSAPRTTSREWSSHPHWRPYVSPWPGLPTTTPWVPAPPSARRSPLSRRVVLSGLLDRLATARGGRPAAARSRELGALSLRGRGAAVCVSLRRRGSAARALHPTPALPRAGSSPPRGGLHRRGQPGLDGRAPHGRANSIPGRSPAAVGATRARFTPPPALRRGPAAFPRACLTAPPRPALGWP